MGILRPDYVVIVFINRDLSIVFSKQNTKSCSKSLKLYAIGIQKAKVTTFFMVLRMNYIPNNFTI